MKTMSQKFTTRNGKRSLLLEILYRMMMSEPSLYILDMYCGPTDERKKRRSYVKDFVK